MLRYLKTIQPAKSWPKSRRIAREQNTSRSNIIISENTFAKEHSEYSAYRQKISTPIYSQSYCLSHYSKQCEKALWDGKHSHRIRADQATKSSKQLPTSIVSGNTLTRKQQHARGLDPFSTSNPNSNSGLYFIKTTQALAHRKDKSTSLHHSKLNQPIEQPITTQQSTSSRGSVEQERSSFFLIREYDEGTPLVV